MVSLRQAQAHPQVISTDRHILQGWVDLTDVRWDAGAKTLSGTAHVIGGDPFTIVIAHNGSKPLKAEATGGQAELKPHADAGLSRLTLCATASCDVQWVIQCE